MYATRPSFHLNSAISGWNGGTVYRLTGKTALMHDITDRGFIAAGKVADITIFDPDTIAPKLREPLATLPAGGIQVKREAVGIDKVIVNGLCCSRTAR